jgi:hypothetical protein
LVLPHGIANSATAPIHTQVAPVLDGVGMDIQTTQKRRLVGTLMAISIGVAACGGSGDEAADLSTPATTEAQAVTTEAEQPDTTETPETSVADTTPAVDEATEPAPTEVPTPATDNATRQPITNTISGTADAPAALLGAQFGWDEERNTQWSFQLHGLLETATPANPDNTCVLLVGVATPTFIEGTYRPVNLSAPDIGFVIDGEYSDGSFGCDLAEVETAGYFKFFQPNGVTGAPINFFKAVVVEGAPASAVQSVVLGEEDEDTAIHFEPTFVESLPARTPAPDNLVLPATSPIAGAVVLQEGSELTLHGLFETPSETSGLRQGAGSCLTLLGTGVLTDIEDGVVDNGQPLIKLIAGGQVLSSTLFCDDSAVEAAGYPAFGQFTTVGTPFAYASSFYVPEALADTATTVIVWDFPGDDYVMLDATIIDAIPPRPDAIPDPVLPATQATMEGADFTWTIDLKEIDWNI